MPKKICLLFSFFVLLLLPYHAALAQSPDAEEEAIERAREYYEKGEVEFRLGRFEEAIKWFEKAFEEVQYPEFLLNIAQCYKQLHQCDKAIFLYKQYLRLGENVDREGTEALIAACEEELKTPPPPPDTNPITPPATEPVIDPATEPVTEPVTPPPSRLHMRLTVEGRAFFAAGSVGSQETGGRNVLGPGGAILAGVLAPLPGGLVLGLRVGLEGHAAGIVAQPDPIARLEGSSDLRGSLGAQGQFALNQQISLVGEGGLTLGAAGSSGVALRLGGGALLDDPLPGKAKLALGLQYDVGGINEDVGRLLGCESGCLYQQLGLNVGILLPFWER